MRVAVFKNKISRLLIILPRFFTFFLYEFLTIPFFTISGHSFSNIRILKLFGEKTIGKLRRHTAGNAWITKTDAFVKLYPQITKRCEGGEKLCNPFITFIKRKMSPHQQI